MKPLFKPLLIAIGLLFTVSGYTQNAVRVDQNFKVQITDQLLQQKFVTLDISDLQFKSELEAQKYFHSIENNLVEFNVDYSAKTATMLLFPERIGNHTWTLDDWNAYIANMSTRCSTTYNAFLNQ